LLAAYAISFLIAAKKKHGIGVLKNKQQLVEALQMNAGKKMLQKVQQEAHVGH